MSEKSQNQEKTEPIRPLAHLNGEKPPAPKWFEDAIAAPSDETSVNVNGAEIRYSAWGGGKGRGLLFVHGGRAHRNWWRPFAPFFANDRRVAALDLSGMGDSDWRETYSLEYLVNEVFAVIDDAGLDRRGRPIVVGHSFGGWVTLAAVERDGERFGGAVVIDSPLGVPDPHEGYNVVTPKPRKPDEKVFQARVYSQIEEPIARFRFLPNQPTDHLYLADYIARSGLKEVDHPDGGRGWTWKFDPAPGKSGAIHFERDLLRAARCPLAFIYGEKSAFVTGREALTHLCEEARGRSPFVMIPDAHHHLMMDQPIAFISTLRTLLSCWPVRFGG